MYWGLRQFCKLRNSPRNTLGSNDSPTAIKGSLLLHVLGLPVLTGMLLRISCPGKLIFYHDQGRWKRLVWLEPLKIHRIYYKVNNYSIASWVSLQFPFLDEKRSPFLSGVTGTSQDRLQLTSLTAACQAEFPWTLPPFLKQTNKPKQKPHKTYFLLSGNTNSTKKRQLMHLNRPPRNATGTKSRLTRELGLLVLDGLV